MTVVVAVALLFARTVSEASLLPVTVFVTEPETAVTLTTTVNDAVPPLASDAIVQLMCRCRRPRASCSSSRPARRSTGTSTPEPIDSVMFAFAAASGPLLVIVCV